MRILFDNSTPEPLIAFLEEHTVVKTRENNWHRLNDGALLDAAEEDGFEVIVIADKNIKFQQNIIARRIAVIVLGNSQWNIARRYVRRIVIAINPARPGTCKEVTMPKR